MTGKVRQKMREIREQTDVTHRLSAAQRSGSTRQLLPPYWPVNDQPCTDEYCISANNRQKMKQQIELDVW